MDELLDPPSDFSVRVPVATVPAQSWYRVHQSRYSALYFDNAPSFRFNAPAGEFGVLYMSEAAEGAFAEALLGSRSRPPQLTSAQLESRALTEFVWRALVLADFTGPGLATLGLDGRISSGDLYPLSRRWAAWVHAHPEQVDGILYCARNLPSVRSVVLFDRVGGPSATKLLEASFYPSQAELGPHGRMFVERFNIAIT